MIHSDPRPRALSRSSKIWLVVCFLLAVVGVLLASCGRSSLVRPEFHFHDTRPILTTHSRACGELDDHPKQTAGLGWACNGRPMSDHDNAPCSALGFANCKPATPQPPALSLTHSQHPPPPLFHPSTETHASHLVHDIESEGRWARRGERTGLISKVRRECSVVSPMGLCLKGGHHAPPRGKKVTRTCWEEEEGGG